MNPKISFTKQRTGRSIALAMMGCLLVSTLFSTATEPDHQFRIEWDSANNLFRLTWPSVNGRTYFLQHTDDLIQQPWNWVPLIESGNGATKEWAFEPTVGTDRGFWRLASSDIVTSDASGSDFDGDGVGNMAELLQGTNPLENIDLLGDGLPDDWQIYKGLNPNDPADGALGDKDEDGLTNAEEIEAGTDVNNPDSDEDGALDGVDGWANEPLLSPPRLPIVRYAVVDLGEGSASRINNVNQVLLENADGSGLWTQGQIDPIKDGETAFYSVSGLNDHGEVVVTYQEETERQEYQYNESTMLLAKQVIGIWKAGSVTPVPFYSDILGELALPAHDTEIQYEVDYGEYGTEINNNSVILGSIGCGIGIEESYGATALWNESAEIVGDITGGNIWDTENGFYLTLPVIGQATSISATAMNNSTLIGTYFVTKKRSNDYFTDAFGLEDTIESGTMYWDGELHKLEGNLAGVPDQINGDGHFIGYAQGDYWQNAIWIKNGSGYNRIFGGISGRMNNKMQIISGSTLWQNFKSYNLVALVPTAMGTERTWDGVGAADINNQGIICGTSKRIRDDQGNPIAPENQKYHAIMLIPISVNHAAGPEIDRPMNYLPRWVPSDGVGQGQPIYSAPTVDFQMSAIGSTMQVTLLGSSYQLNQNGSNPLLYENTGDGITVTLNSEPLNDNQVQEYLQATVSKPTNGIVSCVYDCGETSASSGIFHDCPLGVIMTVSGLDAGTVDTINLRLCGDAFTTDFILTETFADSKIFSGDGMTAKLVNNPTLGSALDVALTLSSRNLSSTVISTTLAATGEYRNFAPPVPTDLGKDPVPDQAGFYIEVPVNLAPTGDTPKVRLLAKVNGQEELAAEVNLVQVADNKWRSEKKLVLTTHDADESKMGTADRSDFQLVRWPEGAETDWTKGGGELKIEYTDAKTNAKTEAEGMVISSIDLYIPQEWYTIPITGLDPEGLIKKPFENLGYTMYPAYYAQADKTKSDYVIGKQIWYSLSHGGTENGYPNTEFTGLLFANEGAIRANDLTPLNLNYRLVIVDGCCSAQTSLESISDCREKDTLLPGAKEFADAFGPNVAYIGWGYEQKNMSSCQKWSSEVVNNLIGKGKTVKQAFDLFQLKYENQGNASAKEMKLYGHGENVIDLKNNPPQQPNPAST